MVKLADFGFSKKVNYDDLRLNTQCGTPLNMAPEVLNGEEYDYKIDIWSLGVIMFELLIGTTPFGGKNLENLRQNVNKGIVRLRSRIDLSPNCLDFVSKCLQLDPLKRMTIDHALNHPFINDNAPKYISDL